MLEASIRIEKRKGEYQTDVFRRKTELWVKVRFGQKNNKIKRKNIFHD